MDQNFLSCMDGSFHHFYAPATPFYLSPQSVYGFVPWMRKVWYSRRLWRQIPGGVCQETLSNATPSQAWDLLELLAARRCPLPSFLWNARTNSWDEANSPIPSHVEYLAAAIVKKYTTPLPPKKWLHRHSAAQRDWRKSMRDNHLLDATNCDQTLQWRKVIFFIE